MRIENLVRYYIVNSYLKTKRSIKEFLKRMVLILGKIVSGRMNTRHNR